MCAEVVGEDIGGRVIASDDPGKLAGAVIDFLDDPALSSAPVKPVKPVRGGFSALTA